VKQIILGITLVMVGMVMAIPAFASFHLMQIEQIIGGVNGDPTKQAIQLRTRGLGENFVSQGRLEVWDAAGANPIVICDPTTDVPNNPAGVRILIASAGFASATSPAAVPDFIMSQLIPVSYFTAGSITWEDNFGTIYWRVSWGGAAYTGSKTGVPLNDADGNFGPPVNGELPFRNTRALLFQGLATALSTSNLADYALTAGNAVFTNNAGTSFTVQPPQTTGVSAPVPGALLGQNHPNPFNPATEIEFSVPERVSASLRVYDTSGQLVASLVEGTVDAGTRRVEWNGLDWRGRAAASGVYFYRLVIPGATETRKMVLLK
jgi:hypothetical protein